MMNKLHPKHEIIRCERCSAPFECKANSFTKCQCSVVPLTLNETQYVSENYEGCLCAGMFDGSEEAISGIIKPDLNHQ